MTPRVTADQSPAARDRDLLKFPGLGPRIAEALARLGIEAPSDLLRHYPARWIDRRQIRDLATLGERDTVPSLAADGRFRKPVVTSLVTVVAARGAGRPRYGRRGAPARLEVVVRDSSGSAALVFFGGGWRQGHFPEGSLILVSGTLSLYRGKVQFTNPEYEFLDGDEAAAIHTGTLVPVYSLTKGVTQRQLRHWMRHAFDTVLPETPDPFPAAFRRRLGLEPLEGALRAYHFPPGVDHLGPARHRLAFEELLFDQLFVQAVRVRRETGKIGPVLEPGARVRRIQAALPFTLTPDQETALAEIFEDLGRPRPANRLLQGDVGSGKTVVALLAAAAAADSGFQTAFLVPTEILAEQHLRTLRELGSDFGLDPRILVGGLSTAARREVLRTLADGSTPVVVGTHALFQEEVRFRNLGLVVVDEQHRFGVMQRVAMMEKGSDPHVLVMSATPIPRSLALVRYADLDLSVIRHRPAGRGKIITRVTPEANREKVYAFLAERLKEGRQAYIIYPLVEESETSELQAATTMAERLTGRPEFAEAGVDLLHGQMPSADKDAVMSRFARGETGILVATTVVEVGIDVPNAAFLIVEHPERYGLSQLHQLRGRIGRGAHTSYCVLIAGEDLDPAARERLAIFAGTEDGFELAERDLELRGQGDVAGVRQSGRPGFRLADPIRDRDLVELARREARDLLEQGTLLGDGGAEWEPLRRELAVRLAAAGDLADAG